MIISAAQLLQTELAPPLRAALRKHTLETVTLRWFGSRIAVRFDQADAAAIFRARYGAFLTTGAPDLAVYAVSASRGGPAFWAEPGPGWRHAEPIDAAAVIAFLADAVVQHAFFDVNRRVISFHAASLQAGDAAIAISATSTGGKSTTALACVRRGLGLYGDERCTIVDGKVHAFPRALNLRRGGIDLLTALRVSDDGGITARLALHAGADWEGVGFEALLGHDAIPAPRPLRLLLFIEGFASSPRLEALDRAETISCLMAAGFCGPQAGLDRVAAATRLSAEVRSYATYLGDPDESAVAIIAAARDASAQPAVAAS